MGRPQSDLDPWLLDAIEGFALVFDESGEIVGADSSWLARGVEARVGEAVDLLIERAFGPEVRREFDAAREQLGRLDVDRITAVTPDGGWRLQLAEASDGRFLGQLIEASGSEASSATRQALVEEVDALRVELSRMHEAYDFAGVGFWRVDTETEAIWWSDETFRIYGRAPGDLPGLSEAINHYAPEAREAIAAAVQRGVNDLTPWDLELPFIQADGTRIWVRATGRAERVGTSTVLFGAFIDITEKKTREAEARHRDEKLSLMVNGSHDGYWDWDLTTDEVWYSPRYQELLGYDSVEMPHRIETFADLLHPDDREVTFAAVEHHLKTRAPYQSEHRLLAKDGSYRWFRARGQAIWNDEGQATRMSGATTDITLQVKTLSELDEARRLAEEASQSKSEFLANMSHEIRTPMAAILGFADLLVEPDVSAADVASHVATIRRNGEHLIELINDILDLSKIEAGRLEIERVPTSIADEVRTVLDLMRVRASEKGLELTAEFDRSLPSTIPSDPLRLRQVLTNLVGNAIKFTSDGSVRVRASFEPRTDSVRISVQDTGIGIAEHSLEHLFGAFCQADSSTTRKFGGTGLGLTISQRLAGLMDGKITPTSELGVGSCFTLEIKVPAMEGPHLDEPAAPRPGAPVGSRPEPASSLLGGATVLVVDDGADNRKLLSIHLRRAGAEVETAENGRVAIDRLLETEGTPAAPQLVLMDMQMPELDGYAATALLREKGFTLPIIAVTAHAMAGDDRRCLDAGCDGYVVKPIDFPQLVETVAEHLAGPAIGNQRPGVRAEGSLPADR